jgi:hypothetical protein
MDRDNTQVMQSDGTIRKFRKVANFFPRMIDQDTQDIFNNRNGSRAADFNKMVADTIAAGQVANRAEFEQRFIRGMGDTSSNEVFSNQERARELALPLKFYSYTPEVALRYLQRSVENLAQHRAFGQRIGRSLDLFDIAKQQVERSAMPYEQKRWVTDRLTADQKAVYSEYSKSPLRPVSGAARQVASGLMIGNWGSAFNYSQPERRKIYSLAALGTSFGRWRVLLTSKIISGHCMTRKTPGSCATRCVTSCRIGPVAIRNGRKVLRKLRFTTAPIIWQTL